jgi:dienelactone hydrolase
MRFPVPPLCLATALVVAGLPSARADDNADFVRDTPVPANQQIPVSDFLRPPLVSRPALNLDGTKIAAIVSAGDKHMLMVYDPETQKKELADAGTGDKDIAGYEWLDNKRLIIDIDARKLYNLGLYATEVGSISDYYPIVQNYGSVLISVSPTDRLHPLVWNRIDTFHANGKDLGVSMVNTDLRGGKIVNLSAAGSDYNEAMDVRDDDVRHLMDTYPTPPQGICVGYWADITGKLEFAETLANGAPLLFRFDGGKWLKCPVELEDNEIFGVGSAPYQVAMLGPREQGKGRPLQFIDTVTGKWGDVLVPEKTHDFTGWLHYDPISYDIIGATSQREFPHTTWFTDQYDKLQKILDGYFPGMHVEIIGSNQAQDMFLVSTYSDRQPTIFNWVNIAKKKIGAFKSSKPWIDAKRMQPVQVFKFKTRDGYILDAYLTLPVGASKAHPAPLVVLPHGGPWARDNWGFDGEAQFLASRGYAVLKPNYRGSVGSEGMFPVGDEWDFLKMHYDVTDATKAALATGFFDPRRVAIMGGSFGGYLALEGVTNEPDLYRCAVSIAGVFDWEKLIADKKWDYEHSATDAEFSRLMRMLGDPKKNPAKFDAIAPVRHTDRIKVPVFVNHGGYDPVSDITQSTDLISALDRSHVPYEKFIVAEETHGMAHLSNDVELYSRIEAFLNKNMPAASGGGTAGSP